MREDSEARLITRCLKGDPDGWDELFHLQYAPAMRFIFQLGFDLSQEDAEEICQETFLAVIRNLRAFHGGSRLQTWIFRIAANKAKDYREKQQAAKRGGGIIPRSLHEEDPETGLAIDPPAIEPTPDEVLLNQERLMMLQDALDQLGDPCREILQLRYFGDLSYGELAEALGLKVKTVSSRLSKCLDRLEILAKGLFSREKAQQSPV